MDESSICIGRGNYLYPNFPQGNKYLIGCASFRFNYIRNVTSMLIFSFQGHSRSRAISNHHNSILQRSNGRYTTWSSFSLPPSNSRGSLPHSASNVLEPMLHPAVISCGSRGGSSGSSNPPWLGSHFAPLRHLRTNLKTNCYTRFGHQFQLQFLRVLCLVSP